jgi:hypothetical protein
MLLLKRRPLPGDALDEVGEASYLVAIVDEREDVDLNGHRGLGRQLVLREGSKDGLRANYDHLGASDDLTCRPDRMLELVASHQLARRRISDRSF